MGKEEKIQDPQACTDYILRCTFSECKFTCTSGKCLYLGSLVCNQQNDCGDNSDEENCLLVTEHPPPGIFNCKSHLLTLVSLSWILFLKRLGRGVLGKWKGCWFWLRKEILYFHKGNVFFFQYRKMVCLKVENSFSFQRWPVVLCFGIGFGYLS